MKNGLRYLVAVFIVMLSSSLFAQQRLTLDEAISIALENNSQVKNATNAVGQNRAGRWNAWSGILPNISLNGGPTKFYQAPSTSIDSYVKDGTWVQETVTSPVRTRVNYNAGINYNQNLWDWGRNISQLSQSNSNINAAEFGLQNTKFLTIFIIKQNYYNLAKLIEQKKVLEESLEMARRQLEVSQNQYTVGTVAQGDVYRSEVSVGSNQISLLDHEVFISNAKQLLNMSMGREVGMDIQIEENLNLAVNYSNSLDNLITKGLNNSPLLKQNEEFIKSASSGVKMAKASRFPSLRMNGGYSRSNTDLDRVYKNFKEDYSWSAGLSLNFSLFDGFQRKANIQNNEYLLNINEENYDNNQRLTESNIRQYTNELAAFKLKITINETMVKSAQEDYRLADERYKIGSGTLLEVITARSNLTSARYRLVSLQYDSKTKEAQIKSATGEVDAKFSSAVYKK